MTIILLPSNNVAVMSNIRYESLYGHRCVFSLSATRALKETQPIRPEDRKYIRKICILIVILPVTDI